MWTLLFHLVGSVPCFLRTCPSVVFFVALEIGKRLAFDIFNVYWFQRLLKEMSLYPLHVYVNWVRRAQIPSPAPPPASHLHPLRIRQEMLRTCDHLGPQLSGGSFSHPSFWIHLGHKQWPAHWFRWHSFSVWKMSVSLVSIKIVRNLA